MINDNAFKFLVVFLFINLWGVAHSGMILFWAGAIYVLPFLLFSSTAGILADRISKQKLIVILKASEVLVMICGVFAFWLQEPIFSYGTLFLLSLQSAVFSPPKYSIIPELAKTNAAISKANGLITSSTYLAIIAGTALASILTQITKKNFPLSALVCVFFALIGFVFSLFIPKTTPSGSKKKFDRFFLYEIYQSLKACKDYPPLLTIVLGASCFLFIGAFFQLNVIPFAIQSLKLTELWGGYLFTTTAIGIAGGAILAGKLCKKKVEIGIAIIGLILLCTGTFVLTIFSHDLLIAILILVFIGLTGGLFIVPLDTYIQSNTPLEKRGQIIAASNFLSFVGVLLAALLILLLGSGLDLSARQGFVVIAFLMLGIILFLLISLKQMFFGFFSHLLVKLLYKLRPSIELIDLPSKIVITHISSYLEFFILFDQFRDHETHFYYPLQKKKFTHYLKSFFVPIHYFKVKNLKESVLEEFSHHIEKNKKSVTPILLFPSIHFLQTIQVAKQLEELKKKYNQESTFLSIDCKKGRFPFKRGQIQMHIHPTPNTLLHS